jgi:4-amino-4-deoxy-L-arabinose transferase-like glycosyltransferase
MVSQVTARPYWHRPPTRIVPRRFFRLWPLAVAILVTLALGVPTLLFPLGPDQAIFAYIAHRISGGGFPFVDAWDQKPPGIYLLYVIALHLPGAIMRDVRIFDLLTTFATLGCIYLLAGFLWNRAAAFFAALLYGVAYTTEYGWWHTAQPDGYTAIPLCLATWLYYRYLSRRSVWPYVLAGMLTGFAFQLRFFAALIGLVLLYIEWNQAEGRGRNAWSNAARRILWFSAGFALMQAAFALYLLVGHALGAYIMTEFTFASRYSRLGGAYSPNGLTLTLYVQAARGITIYFLSSHFFITIPAIVPLALSLRRCGDRRVREIALLAFMGYVGVLIQAKFFWYHFLAVLPFLAILGGKGLADIMLWLSEAQRRIVTALAMAALALGLLLLSPAVTGESLQQWRGVAEYYGGPAKREAFNNQFGPYAGGTFSYLADDQVARYVKERSQPGETIYVYGYDALVYLLSERDSASRFFYVFPVIATWTPPSWRAEWINELETKAPRYILVQANEGAPWITGLHEDTGRYAAHDPDLQRLLAANYQLETTIEDFTLYRKSD